MKLSFSTLGCPEWGLDEIIKAAQVYGYDGVELRAHDEGVHVSTDLGRNEAADVGAKFRDAGCPINSLIGYAVFAKTDPSEIAQQQALGRKLIATAEAMHVPFVRMFAGILPPDSDHSAMVDVVGDAITPLAEEAADKGITIGIETHDDWCSGELIMQLLHLVDSPGLGIVYDIFNAFHSAFETWDVTYNTIRDHIVYCHLKDARRDGDNNIRYVMTGTGDLPIADIVTRLKADGYDKFLSFEWEKMWHEELEEPDHVFPQFSGMIRSLWDQT